jgi:hypothetical protein
MKRVLAAFANNTVFANILLVLIFLAGGIAAMSMIRETFPEFSVDIITVSVAYPGADPEEVEEGISRKIEEALEGLEGVKQYTTQSRENVSNTIIEVKESYDINVVIDRVRSKVDAISTFPVDAEEPVITEITFKDPVMLLYLSGDMSERRIKEWAESIKDEIQQIPEISQVTVFGARDYEIAIEVSEERLREYGLTFTRVVEAVRRSNLNLAGGTIRTQGEEIRVRTVGRKYTGKELSQIVVLARPEGEIITLDRLAVINDGFTEDPIRALRRQPQDPIRQYRHAPGPHQSALKERRHWIGDRFLRLVDVSQRPIILLVRHGHSHIYFGSLGHCMGRGRHHQHDILVRFDPGAGDRGGRRNRGGRSHLCAAQERPAAVESRGGGRLRSGDAGDCSSAHHHRGLFAPGLCGRRHGKIHRYSTHDGHLLSGYFPGGMPNSAASPSEPSAGPQCQSPQTQPRQSGRGKAPRPDLPAHGMVRGPYL